MDAKLFRETYGVKRCQEVAIAAGTNPAYFRQICSGNRRPSVKLAKKLVEASKGELDFVSLLNAKEEAA